MDLSPVGTIGELVRYVSDYISKSEPESLDNSITQIIQKAKSEGYSAKAAALQKVARLMESKRIVSIQEAIFLLLHLPYRLSSRKFVFINSRVPSDRARLMRKEAMAETPHDKAHVQIDPDAFYANIFDRYSVRPQAMENTSLYEFATKWEVDYKKTSKSADRDSDDEHADLDEAPFRNEEVSFEGDEIPQPELRTHKSLRR